MSADVVISSDSLSPKLQDVARFIGSKATVRYVGRAALAMTRSHLNELAPNKMGWPSVGLYRGTKCVLVTEENAARLQIDNPSFPGAIKHQYNRGHEGMTIITAGDKLLTIPARAEFYGHRAGEFTNLRFVKFPSGAMALVIGSGGASRLGMRGGQATESNRGIGARTRGMVAYWLKDHVEQQAKPEVLPSQVQYALVVREAVSDMWEQIALKGGQG